MAQRTIHAFIRRGERPCVAECIKVSVLTEGATLNETVANLREAVALRLQGEALAELGLVEDPALGVAMELEKDT